MFQEAMEILNVKDMNDVEAVRKVREDRSVVEWRCDTCFIVELQPLVWSEQ